MKRLALVAAVVLAAVAVFSSPPAQAQTQCGPTTTCFGSPKQQIRIGGTLLIDKPLVPTTAAGLIFDGGVTVVGNETLTGVLKVSAIDAGAIYAQGTGPITRILPFNTGAFDFASVTTTCNETGAITVTGAQANDACVMAPPSSGGSANAAYTCYVSATNQVKVRHCAVGTADDPASATYFGIVLSAQ